MPSFPQCYGPHAHRDFAIKNATRVFVSFAQFILPNFWRALHGNGRKWTCSLWLPKDIKCRNAMLKDSRGDMVPWECLNALWLWQYSILQSEDELKRVERRGGCTLCAFLNVVRSLILAKTGKKRRNCADAWPCRHYWAGWHCQSHSSEVLIVQLHCKEIRVIDFGGAVPWTQNGRQTLSIFEQML